MTRRKRRSTWRNVLICTAVLALCCGVPWLLPGCKLYTAPLGGKSHDVYQDDEDAGR